MKWQPLGQFLGVTLQTELIALAIVGIICTIFDTSLLEINDNLYKIWETKMDPDRFASRVELYMKYLLSSVVLIRTFTVHIYLGCYIILLYPIIFEDRPGLIVPWLFVSGTKWIFTGFINFAAGFYTCLLYKFMKPTCWEFMLAQLVDQMPSIYMFMLVSTFYKRLKRKQRVNFYVDPLERQVLRRKTRLIHDTLEASELPPDSRDSSYRQSENILINFQPRRSSVNSRSLDSLLSKLRSSSDDGGLEYMSKLNFPAIDEENMSRGRTRPSKDIRFLSDKEKLPSFWDTPTPDVSTTSSNNYPETSRVRMKSLSSMALVKHEPKKHEKVKADAVASTNSNDTSDVRPEMIGSAKPPSPQTPRKAKSKLSTNIGEIVEGGGYLVTKYYNENAIDGNSYKDDGYTQAFFASLNKKCD